MAGSYGYNTFKFKESAQKVFSKVVVSFSLSPMMHGNYNSSIFSPTLNMSFIRNKSGDACVVQSV